MRRVLLVLGSLGLLLGTAAPTRAAVAVAGPGGYVAGFATPVVVIGEGEGVTFANSDIARHNFIATDAFVPKKKAKKVEWCSGYRRGQCPLFWSEAITAGESTEVRGLERVKSGKQYGFYCSLHPNMRGTLVVR